MEVSNVEIFIKLMGKFASFQFGEVIKMPENISVKSIGLNKITIYLLFTVQHTCIQDYLIPNQP